MGQFQGAYVSCLVTVAQGVLYVHLILGHFVSFPLTERAALATHQMRNGSIGGKSVNASLNSSSVSGVPETERILRGKTSRGIIELEPKLAITLLLPMLPLSLPPNLRLSLMLLLLAFCVGGLR